MKRNYRKGIMIRNDKEDADKMKEELSEEISHISFFEAANKMSGSASSDTAEDWGETDK